MLHTLQVQCCHVGEPHQVWAQCLGAFVTNVVVWHHSRNPVVNFHHCHKCAVRMVKRYCHDALRKFNVVILLSIARNGLRVFAPSSPMLFPDITRRV